MEARHLRTLLAEKYNDSKDRHAYFLLSIAGAGVAFAIQKTEGHALTWGTCPAVAALVCWVGSFVAGIALIKRTQKILQLEFTLADIRAKGEDQGIDQTNEFKDSIDPMYDDIQGKRRAATRYQSLQVNLLGAGVIALAAWYLAGIFTLGK